MKEFKEKFMTQSKFSTMVEEVVKNSNGLVNYIDAVIVVCDELDVPVRQDGSHPPGALQAEKLIVAVLVRGRAVHKVGVHVGRLECIEGIPDALLDVEHELPQLSLREGGNPDGQLTGWDKDTIRSCGGR